MEVLCEVSVRHVHLSQEHVNTLFGKGHKLTPARELSQPGQYLCEERVDLMTPKATFKDVAIIGPTRAKSQVELSRTDCFTLGLKNVPIRQSGHLDGSVGISIKTNLGTINLDDGVIIGQRHVHLDPETASKNNLIDGQIVGIQFDGSRSGVLGNTVVRVHETFSSAIHIDTDEGNAMNFSKGTARIIV